eukprot:COSAG04_NODE_22456_length_354_cov_1.266667_1_plen_64_part_10
MTEELRFNNLKLTRVEMKVGCSWPFNVKCAWIYQLLSCVLRHLGGLLHPILRSVLAAAHLPNQL